MATKKPARKTKGLKKPKKLEANKPLLLAKLGNVSPVRSRDLPPA